MKVVILLVVLLGVGAVALKFIPLPHYQQPGVCRWVSRG